MPGACYSYCSPHTRAREATAVNSLPSFSTISKISLEGQNGWPNQARLRHNASWPQITCMPSRDTCARNVYPVEIMSTILYSLAPPVHRNKAFFVLISVDPTRLYNEGSMPVRIYAVALYDRADIDHLHICRHCRPMLRLYYCSFRAHRRSRYAFKQILDLFVWHHARWYS